MNRRSNIIWVMILVPIVFTFRLQAKPQSNASRHSAPAKQARPGNSVAAPASHATAAGRDFSASYRAYGDRLRSKLYSKWLIPDGKNHVTVSALLSTDGSVSNMALASSPHDTQAEQAANDAFNQAQPLEPLPAGSPPAKLTLTFESAADPHGDTKSHLSMMLVPIAGGSPPPAAGESPGTANKSAEKTGNGK